MKPEVAGSLPYEDSTGPPSLCQRQRNQLEGNSGLREKNRPHQATATGLIKMASGWQMQGPMKGRSRLTLVCTELHSATLFSTTLDYGCPSPILWSPGTHGPVRGVTICGERVGTTREGGRWCNYRPMKRSSTPLYASSHLILTATWGEGAEPVSIPQGRPWRSRKYSSLAWTTELVPVGMGLICLVLSQPLFCFLTQRLASTFEKAPE